MKTLFSKSFLFFLAGFLVLLIIMGFLLFGGYNLAVNAWKIEKESQAHNYALDYLSGRESEAEVPMASENIFILLDQNQNLLYSNHGRGMTLRFLAEDPPDLIPLYKANKLLGYYYLAPPRFADDLANRKFIEAMMLSLMINTLLSVIVALIFAFVFSQSISRPAVQLSQGLDRMASGDHEFQIRENGPKELVLIASSANHLNLQLKTEKAMRDQWAHDITHDLRTPIASLQAQLEAMADGVLDMNQERILRNLKELKRMEKLVKDLEILMRLEQPEIKLTLKNLSTSALAESLKHRFQHMIEEKSINFKWDSQLDFVKVDEDLMLRGLSNLFSNAIRHTPEKGTIELTVRKEASHTAISLFNSGSYISPEEKEKIFHRLYRGEYARKTPGSGLGLSITQQIVKIHGGDILLESTENEGTRFTILLAQN